MINIRTQIIIAIFIIIALYIIVNMIRKRQLELKYALAWLNIINLRKKWKGICSQVPFIVLKYRQGCI